MLRILIKLDHKILEGLLFFCKFPVFVPIQALLPAALPVAQGDAFDAAGGVLGVLCGERNAASVGNHVLADAEGKFVCPLGVEIMILKGFSQLLVQ